jgi:type 1 glutamine amidotransferase
MVDAAGKDTIIARAEIVNLHPTGQSLMPIGLLDSLNEGQIRNLLTYLLYEPVVREKSQVIQVLAGIKPTPAPSPVNLVLVASKQDHGPDQHDYPAWQKRWHQILAKVPSAQIGDAWEWPSSEQFEKADVLVFYFWNHDWSPARLEQIDRFQARGGGIVLIHSAVIADTNPEALVGRFGLAAQPSRVKYRHTVFDLDLARNKSFTRNLPDSLRFLDEPYWPMIGDVAKVSVLASAKVDGEARPLVWAFENGKGRVFASIPGHYAATLADPLWRVLCLRGIAWAAGRDDGCLLSAVLDDALVK